MDTGPDESFDQFQHFWLYAIIWYLSGVLRGSGRLLSIQRILGRHYCSLPYLFYIQLLWPCHRRRPLPHRSCVWAGAAAPWRVHNLGLNNILATLPRSKHLLWHRKWLTLLSSSHAGFYLFLRRPSSHRRFPGRMQWWDGQHGVSSTSAIILTADKIWLDGKSHGFRHAF